MDDSRADGDAVQNPPAKEWTTKGVTLGVRSLTELNVTVHVAFCTVKWHCDIPERIMGVSENVVYYPKANGFADHYPVFKWL